PVAAAQLTGQGRVESGGAGQLDLIVVGVSAGAQRDGDEHQRSGEGFGPGVGGLGPGGDTGGQKAQLDAAFIAHLTNFGANIGRSFGSGGEGGRIVEQRGQPGASAPDQLHHAGGVGFSQVNSVVLAGGEAQHRVILSSRTQ